MTGFKFKKSFIFKFGLLGVCWGDAFAHTLICAG
jgi:hypothetical protein